MKYLIVVVFIFLAANCNAVEIDMHKIKMIESSGNALAYNKGSKARGHYQITPICLKEWNNFHPKNKYTADDLWNADVNYKIANWYMNVRIPALLKHFKKEDTVRNRLISFNAGIGYVVHGWELKGETVGYIRKYGI